MPAWSADLDDPRWPDGSGLPAIERGRAASIIDPRRRRRWVASRWALRRLLGSRVEEDPHRVELVIGERGKPELASGALRFGLSHRGGVGLIALSPRLEVGVDIEMVRAGRDFQSLSTRFLDANATSRVRSAPASRRAEVFYRAWTRHEAVRKLTGCVIPASIPPAARIVDLDVGTGWAAALALADPAIDHLGGPAPAA